MITCEEALAIAQAYDDQVCHCVEYEKAYIFDNGFEPEITEKQPYVVSKETGKGVPYDEFLATGADIGDKLGEWMIHVPLVPPKDYLEAAVGKR